MVRVYVPGVDAMFNLNSQTWQFARFFDGQRSYRKVSEAYLQGTWNAHIRIEEVQEVGGQS